MTEIVIRYLQLNYPLTGSGVEVSSTNRKSKATPFLPLADGSPVGRVYYPVTPPDQGYVKSCERVMNVVEEAPAVIIHSAGSHNWHQA